MIEASKQFMQTAESLPTLFHLEAELFALTDALDSEEPTDEQVRLLAELEEMLAARVETYCQVIETFERFRDARKAAADRLRDRAAAHANTVERLRERLKQHMLATGQQRIETHEHTIRLQANPPRVDVLEELLVLNEFKKVVVTSTVDKRAILEHHKRTGEVPEGVEIVRDSHIRIV